MIKIVFTIGTLQIGGAEVFVVNLIKNLDLTKFVPELIVLDKQNKTFLETTIESLGIKTYYMNKPVGFSLKTHIKVYRILRKIKPDIIHGNIGGIIYSLLYVFFNKKVSAVHTAHTNAKIEFGKLKRILLKYFYLRKRIIPVVLSNNNVDEFISTYKINKNLIKVISNGVDINKFNCVRNFANSMIRLGHVGRFEEVKNHKLIFLVYDDLVSKGYNVSLRLIGNGSLLEEYKYKYIDKNVCFIQETQKVEEELRKIDIFIFPSLYEGLPISVIEAMASGCVIVASCVGGIVDLIENEVNGYKLKYYSVKSYSAIIEKLIKNPWKMMEISLNNKNKAKQFAINKTIKKYEKLYKELYKC